MNLVINESQPLWEYLRCAEKPVALYGMGDGALKILAVCRQYGIPIAGIFASDEFVRGHSFEGYPVESLAQIEERLGDFIVLLCFGVDYDSMLERIAELSRHHETYAPDIPVFGSDLFTAEYFREPQAEFEQDYGQLADDESRQIYADLLALQAQRQAGVPLPTHGQPGGGPSAAILTPGPGSVYVDLGAYDGDTVEEFIRHCPDYGWIWALEPDPKNFRKLQAAAGELPRTTLVPKGSYSGEGELTFSARGGRNSALAESGKKLRPVELTSVDALLQGNRADYIKMDVEGVERETLLGCRETIARWKPQLSVAGLSPQRRSVGTAAAGAGAWSGLPAVSAPAQVCPGLGDHTVRHIRATVVHKWIVILHKNLQTFTE